MISLIIALLCGYIFSGVLGLVSFPREFKASFMTSNSIIYYTHSKVRPQNKIQILNSTVGTVTESLKVETNLLLFSRNHTNTQPRNLPFNMIVGQDRIKTALILLASNPRVGGVLISGGHGTGKSIMAKALHKILPKTIIRVKGSQYNTDITGKYGLDSILWNELIDEGKELTDFDHEEITTPFITIPLNVMEDSLIGTIDLEESIEIGRPVFLPGLLAKAHRGVLYIDDINLLDENIVDILFDVISDGFVKVEREGISIQYPCVPLVVATFNEEEGEIRDHLKDRIAISLSSSETSLSVMQRVKATENYITFTGNIHERSSTECAKKLLSAEESDEILREKIEKARLIVDEVKISHEQVLHLCIEADRAGCEGQRAEIFAAHVAKSNAAFHGRFKVTADDLKVATQLVIAPRSKFLTEDQVDDSVSYSNQETRDTVPKDPTSTEEIQLRKELETEKSQEDNEDKIDQHDDFEQDDKQEIDMELPTEFMFGVTGVPLDPELLQFAHVVSRKGKVGKSSKIFNLVRGRYVKPIFPMPGQEGRIAIGATLRAAAPYQKFRRRKAIATRKQGKNVYVEKDDFRIKRMKRKAGALVIFVVDASGSMALNRMDAAKGAAIALLSEAYKARDKISLIVFHGDKAEILVPPTKSSALTKSRLEAMPCGGGSPLSHALVMAVRVGMNECKIKKDVGRVVIILISDGRVNIPLCISEGENFDPNLMPSVDGRPTKKFLQDEALAVARKIGKLGIDLIVIDTEDKFVSTGIARDIAIASLGKYYCIDPRNIAAIRDVTRTV